MRDDVRRLLDPDLLKDVNDVVRIHGCECLLVGATAFAFSKVQLPRQTLDLDLAVAVDGLEQLRTLEADLEDRGVKKFSPPCSYRYKNGLRIDIIPFGGIAQNGMLCLPEMNSPFHVHGFREALRTAKEFPLECGIPLKVATLPAVFVLKSFAFHDRRRPDDIGDIAAILRYFSENPDTDGYFGLRPSPDVDYEDIGIVMLGRTIRDLLETDTAAFLRRAWTEILAADSAYIQAFPNPGMIGFEEQGIWLERFERQIRIVTGLL